MTDSPAASQYQWEYEPNSLFQPAVSPSDSDYSDEQTALQEYQDVYGTGGTVPSGSGEGPQLKTTPPPYPTLAMAYTKAPDLIPALQGSQSQDSLDTTTPPAAPHPIYIQLGSLLSTEGTFLRSAQDLVNDYQTLLPIVQNAINSSTFFGQLIGQPIPPQHPSGQKVLYQVDSGDGGSGSNGAAGNGGSGLSTEDDPLDQQGVDFAATINPQLGLLLQQAGDLIEAVGQFTAMINEAGQLYTNADAQSVFPPPDLMEGPTPPYGPGATADPVTFYKSVDPNDTAGSSVDPYITFSKSVDPNDTAGSSS